MVNTANFFWNGTFSLYEYACIASFVKNKFEVSVFSYNNTLELPDGAMIRDARDIMPEDQLYAYTSAGTKGSMPTFADAFRYRMLKKEGGWWFDTDILCIQDANAYQQLISKKQIPISVGIQDDKYINNGVIYADDKPFVDALLGQLEKNGTDVRWGENGPKLITKIIHQLNYFPYADPLETYYPISGNDLIKMFDPIHRTWCESKVAQSLGVHLWNEVIRRNCIPKNMLPPAGSFLAEKFLDICPEMADNPHLPAETVHRLIDYARLQVLENKDIKALHKAKEAAEKLMDWIRK